MRFRVYSCRHWSTVWTKVAAIAARLSAGQNRGAIHSSNGSQNDLDHRRDYIACLDYIARTCSLLGVPDILRVAIWLGISISRQKLLIGTVLAPLFSGLSSQAADTPSIYSNMLLWLCPVQRRDRTSLSIPAYAYLLGYTNQDFLPD